MADSKKIVIVGIPGVGKTSLVTRLVELIRQKNKSVSVHSYGTVMLEEAKKIGVENRDELRMLPIEKQKKLQKTAAETLSNLTDDVIFIDTHAFISTKAGFYPGLPNYVIQIIQPTHFIASPRPRGSTPVTCGSKVPLCPAFGISRIFFAHATTW